MKLKRVGESARERFRRELFDNRIQEEARIANDLMRDYPGMKRSEALRLAAGLPYTEEQS